MRQAVAAIDDKTAQLKLSKESERRIHRLRRDFEEQFNSTVVAHKSGADKAIPTPSRISSSTSPSAIRSASRA
jgi:DNA mismatch repair protein MutS2